MDGTTLILVLALVAALTAVSQFLLHLIQRDMPGVRPWACACALIAAGLIATGQRHSFPLIAFGNWLVFLGHALMLASVRVFSGAPPRTGPLLIAATLAILPILALPRTDEDVHLRIAALSATLALFSGAIAAAFPRIPGLIPRFNAAMFGLNAALHLARAGWALLRPQAADATLSGAVSIAVMLWSLAMLFEVAVGFTLMVSEKLRDDLRRQANLDPLTGILNRRGFDLVAGHAAQRGPRALLMIDIDRFKRINDTFGHPTGDRVLAHFARVAGLSLRDEDVFARIGGDEFVALLPGCDAEAAMRCAERLRAELAQRPPQPPVTLSIGVAADADGATSLAELARRADSALYRTKRGGRDRVALA